MHWSCKQLIHAAELGRSKHVVPGHYWLIAGSYLSLSYAAATGTRSWSSSADSHKHANTGAETGDHVHLGKQVHGVLLAGWRAYTAALKHGSAVSEQRTNVGAEVGNHAHLGGERRAARRQV